MGEPSLSEEGFPFWWGRMHTLYQGSEEVLVWMPWSHQVEVVGGRRKSWRLFPRHPRGWAPQTLVFSSVHLQVCRRGPILPASQGIHGN